MEIFVLIKRLLNFTGIVPIDHPHGKLLSRFILCGSFVIFNLTLIATVWFLIYDAESFLSQALSFTQIVILAYIMSLYVSFTVCIDAILVMFDGLQAKVQERTCFIQKKAFFISHDIEKCFNRLATVFYRSCSIG